MTDLAAQTNSSPLNTREQLFVRVYLQTWNKTKAAQATIKGGKGGHRDYALAVANDILARPHVQAYVQQILASYAPPPEQLVAQLVEQATATIDDVIELDYDDEGRERIALSWAKARANNVTHLVKKLDARKGIVELHDPQKALELLLRVYRLIGSDAPRAPNDPGPQFADFDAAVERVYATPLPGTQAVLTGDEAALDAPDAIEVAT